MAETVVDKVHVVNRALTKLGLPPSYSIDTEDSLGGTVDMVWPGVEAEVAALYDWSDCRQTVLPILQAGTPGNGWTYGWELPGDRVGPPVAVLTDVVRETYLRDFMLEGGVLFTHVSPVWVRVRRLQDPRAWSAAFVEAFATALASALAVPLLQDEDAEAGHRGRAFVEARERGDGGLFGRLMGLERGAQPQGRNFMAYDPLTNARFG